jgi:hypothetical protein
VKKLYWLLHPQNYDHFTYYGCIHGIEQYADVFVYIDWTGIEGEDKYPPFMNPEISWPDGASTGQPLRHEHDIYWLNDLLSDIPRPQRNQLLGLEN